MKKFESGYLHPSQTCMWRFVAASVTAKFFNITSGETLYRMIKVRVAGVNAAKVKAVIIENPLDVRDTVALFEKDLGNEWDMVSKGDGLTQISAASQLYVMTLPQDYGGSLHLEYFVDYVKDPNAQTTFTTDMVTSTAMPASEESDSFFNDYTRKVVSYLISSLFGFSFVYGGYRIYKVFFSAEAQIMGDITKEIKEKKQRELDLEQRRKREEKWLAYQQDNLKINNSTEDKEQ